MTIPDQRHYAPAVERNRCPILEVLEEYLPSKGIVLEIASGSGEHAAFFAQHLSALSWIPSDIAQPQLESILAWQRQSKLDNLYPPISVDVLQPHWPTVVQKACSDYQLSTFDITAIININMLHISPWQATLGLISGAAQLLSPQGILYLYGPFIQLGQPTAPSNLAFDQFLRSREPAWGIRNLEEVVMVAAENGLILQKTIAMPANNLSVIWRLGGDDGCAGLRPTEGHRQTFST